MNWPVKKLGNFIEIVMGQAPHSDQCNKEGEGIVFVKAGEFGIESPVIREWTTNPLKMAKPDDTLICVVGATAGKINRSRFECAIGRSVAAVRTRTNEVEQNYLHAFLSTKVIELRNRSQGAAQAVITREMLQDIEILIPPLAEQQRIAALLDTADRILKQRELAIAKLDQLAQSVFVNMFGDLVGNLNNWQVVKLNDACLIKAQYGAGLSAVEFNASLPRYVRITDINEDGFLNEKVVSPSGSKSDWQDYFLNDGDILFARSGSVGKAYLHSNQIHQCIFAGYLIRFVPNKKLMTSEFLYALTKSAFYKKWVEAKQNAVAQPNINANQYGNELVFPLPPIILQEEFTNFYKKIKSFKEVELLASIKLNQLQSSLQHQSFAVN